MCGSRVVVIQSASSGSGALRYADYMSIVAILNLLIVASCRKREKVSGIMVGLYVVGNWKSALIMARRSVSTRAAPRALCLSGSPFAFFLRLHLRVVLIFHVRLLVSFSVYPPSELWWIGTSVPVSLMSV